jgi:hypothetical protein
MSSRRASRILGALLVAAVAAGRAHAFQDTTRVSVDSAGAQGNASSYWSAISSDGRFVVYVSAASNLVSGDNNQKDDIFVHDRSTGTNERVSLDSSGNEGNDTSNFCFWRAISGDGTVVAFSSGASNLDANDTNGRWDAFVHDRGTGSTTLFSLDSSGNVGNDHSQASSISDNGLFACFQSVANNLVKNDKNNQQDVFLRDFSTGLTERISVDSAGVEGNGISQGGVVSSDGRYVVFDSTSTNLVAGDTNAAQDVFLRDRQSGSTVRVSVDSSGKQAKQSSALATISADGRYVAFFSWATNLVPGDTNGHKDVFVRDVALGTTVRVSVDSSGGEGDLDSEFSVISLDGRFVAFESEATNLVAGDTNGTNDVFLHDMVTGATTRLSVDSSGREANGYCNVPSISADGSRVSFSGSADNLVAHDTNGLSDVFVHEQCSTPATWTNYGAGYPGTLGVPAFTAQQFPWFGATVTVDLANSYGAPTIGLLVLGLQRASLPTKWGGDLLVLPTLIAPITFSFGGDSFTGTIPDDVDLCGATIDLQGIEADPGAQFGVSFSPGLELVIGN